MNLVEVKKKDVVCDSSTLARQLGVKHAEVVRRIESMLNDYPDLRVHPSHPNTVEKFYTEKREYRRQGYTAYLMNKEFFSLLMVRFTTPRAREWQRKFNAAFYDMEKTLLKQQHNSGNTEWLKLRQQSKEVRLQQTDVIKEFVEYAINQGSRNAQFYYKHITNATYQALQLIQHKKPKLKDTLDTMELSQLMVAENVAKKSIRKHMNEGEHYKTVFTLVKQDLETFGASLMIGMD